MTLRYKVERLEHEGRKQTEQLKEARLTIKRLQREISRLNQELNPSNIQEVYSVHWSWTNKVIFVLSTVGLPLRVIDLVDELQKIDETLFKKPSPSDYLSTVLIQAVRRRRLVSFKPKHIVGEFFALPDWADKLNAWI